jgi:hypothetical protein
VFPVFCAPAGAYSFVQEANEASFFHPRLLRDGVLCNAGVGFNDLLDSVKFIVAARDVGRFCEFEFPFLEIRPHCDDSA